MTDILLIAIALFLVSSAVTLCLLAVLAPNATTRRRAHALLLQLLDRKKWNTRLELANAMFEYLEIWHNRKRRHGQLGWLTPVQFERNRITTVA